MIAPVTKLPLHIKVGNGFGSVAYGVKDNGFATFLLIFYNQVMGLDAALVGVTLLVALVLDAFVDPIVGHFGDKTHTKWGKRHPWMYSAILPMAFFWLMLWYPPELPEGVLYLYLLAFAFLMRAAVSCYEVPSLAVIPALTADYDERTSITRWRFLFAWAGGLIMMTLAFGVLLVPTPEYPVGIRNVRGYELYGWIGALFIIVAGFTAALTTHRRVARLPDVEPTHLPPLETFRKVVKILSNRAFLVLICSLTFAFINQGMTFSSASYMLNYYWEIPPTLVVAYSATLLLGVVGSFFLVGWMQGKVDKKQGAIVSGILALVIAISPYALRMLDLFPANGSSSLVPVLFTLSAAANAFAVCSMILGQSMASDVIEDAEYQTGERTEGLFFAGYFFTQKVSVGLGIAITAAIVSIANFPANAVPGQIDQNVIGGLGTGYVAVMIVSGILSIIPLLYFPISRESHNERLRVLNEAAKSAS